MTSPNASPTYSSTKLLKFIIPSLIGLFLFVIPLPYKGNFSIGVGMMADQFKQNFGGILPGLMTLVILLSALLSLAATVLRPAFLVKPHFMKNLFDTTPLWLSLRLIGGLFAILTFFGLGPDIIVSPYTGGTILNDLLPTLATWFFFSGIFLPLLMDFGSMDFIGTLIRKVMKPLFKIPGRAAIDAIASWIGSGPVGVVITNKQYGQGFYTAKESSIIAVCFSLVSLPFAVFVASFLKLEHVFLQFYGAIAAASLVAALILPRIWPLNKKSDAYHPAVGKQINEEVPPGRTIGSWALEKGVARASVAKRPAQIVLDGVKTVADVYFSLMPLVMALGTISLIIAEHTPIFTWISYPLIFLLEALQVPGAATAAPALLVGFADMFLPAILVANLEFEITRFIIGAISFTQLIYMTETGAIILKSEIPLTFKDLFILFLQRTAITLPVVVFIAHLVY